MIDRDLRNRLLGKLDVMIDSGIASEEEKILRNVLDYKNSDRYIDEFLTDNSDFRLLISKM